MSLPILKWNKVTNRQSEAKKPTLQDLAQLVLILLATLVFGLRVVTPTDAASMQTAVEMLKNASLTEGMTSRTINDWGENGWFNAPGITSYLWDQKDGILTLVNHQPNDSRWYQNVTLQPGFYSVSADARADQLSKGIGASVGFVDYNLLSPQVLTNEWTTVGFILKIDAVTDLTFALRLGGPSSLVSGVAQFRNPHVQRIGYPPVGTQYMDMRAIKLLNQQKPLGHAISLVLTVGLLFVSTVVGWRLMLLGS